MKKILIGIAFLIVMSIGLSANIEATSSTGWHASSGLNSQPGVAETVKAVQGGYLIKCVGAFGICYLIDGNKLTIYTNILSPVCEPTVGIYQN